MMQNVFLIPMSKIDDDWNLPIIDYDFCPFEYCEEILDIPEESIYDAHLTAHGIELCLMNINEVIHEDWCIQLERIAKHKMVA